MTTRKVLLVNGSPKESKSFSQSLVDFMSKKLNEFSVENEMLRIDSPSRSDQELVESNRMVDNACAIVFVFPLYNDQPPSGMIKLLEDYSFHRKTHPSTRTQAIMAILHNRFPEATQNDHAMGVICHFAQREGFRWLGGLTIAEAGMLEKGMDFQKYSVMTRKIRIALEAASLCMAGVWKEPLPESIQEELQKPLIPAPIYRFFINWGFRAGAKKGLQTQWNARPFSKIKN